MEFQTAASHAAALEELRFQENLYPKKAILLGMEGVRVAPPLLRRS
jgi:hypothetical protein